MKNFLVVSILILLGLTSLFYISSKKSDCFSPSFVDLNAYPSIFKRDISEKDPNFETVKKILNQPFYYLGSGNQSFAFESEDHQYVIKIMKLHSLYGLNLTEWLPSFPFFQKIKDEIRHTRAKKIERFMKGFEVANKYDPLHCGLLYVHLSSTTQLQTQIHLKDKRSKSHYINLDSIIFAIQEKGIPTGEVLSDLLEKGDVEGAKSKLKSLFNMFADEFQKGIYDADHNVIHNTGFHGNKPFRIDFGKVKLESSLKDPKTRFQELNKIASERIDKWLAKHYPNQRQILMDFVYDIIDQTFTSPL